MPEKTSVPVVFGRGSPMSAACGLLMLLGSVAGAAWLVWQGNGWVVALLAYAAVLGVLLLLEARPMRGSARRRAAEAHAGMIVTAPEIAAEATGAARQARRLPIWLHLVLLITVMLPGYFSGGMLGFCYAMMLMTGLAALSRPAGGPPPEPGGWGSALGGCCGFVVMAPLFFGGAFLGGKQAQRLFLAHVHGRCPACGGDASCKVGSPITYHCRSCGHVHTTTVHAV